MTDFQMLVVLLVSSLVFFLVILLRLNQLERLLQNSLSRLEKQSSRSSDKPDEDDTATGKIEASPGGAFEAFLNENPASRELKKGDQLAAYRQWRQGRGMNWTTDAP
jgi:hypothetical protein